MCFNNESDYLSDRIVSSVGTGLVVNTSVHHDIDVSTVTFGFRGTELVNLGVFLSVEV